MYFGNNDYRDYLEHSAKGQKWKRHKYLYITPNGRYVYPKSGGTSTVHDVNLYGWSRDDDGKRNGIIEIETDTFGGSGRRFGKSKFNANRVKSATKNAAVDKAFDSIFGKTRGSRNSIHMDAEDLREWRTSKNNAERKRTAASVGNRVLGTSRIGSAIRNLYSANKKQKNTKRVASARRTISEAYGLNSGDYKTAKRNNKSRKVARR